jgi:prolyl oligopeptidase PreP (S9A serine peptidase family)
VRQPQRSSAVMPMHSFKFVAGLQAAQAGPALLFLERASGRGGGRTTSQAIDQSASIYAFLIKNLRMRSDYATILIGSWQLSAARLSGN